MVILLLFCSVLSKPLADLLPAWRTYAVMNPSLTLDSTYGAVVFYGLCMVLIAPVAEELFYRAFMLEQLRKLTNSSIALLIHSTIFALGHFPSQTLQRPVAAFLFGMILGTWRIKFKSLLPLILAHIILNGIVSIGPLKRQCDFVDLAVTMGFPTDFAARTRSSPKCQQMWQLTREPVPKAVPAIIGFLGDKEDVVAVYATTLLTNSYRADAEPYLRDALKSNDKEAVCGVLSVIGTGHWPGLKQEVRGIVWSGDAPDVQRRATVTLWELGDLESLREISQRHENQTVSESAKMFIPILFGTRFAHSNEPHASGIALCVTARIILAWPERNARKSATKTSRD